MWTSISARRARARTFFGGNKTDRFFRPHGERLEQRMLLVSGIFIENFSSDFDLNQPGFDQRDDNPLTMPGGDTDSDPLTTLGPDEVQLQHCFRRDFSNPFPCTPPTSTSGNGYFIQGSGFSNQNLFLSATDTITFVGLGPQESVELARIDFAPIGSAIDVLIIGREDTFSVHAPFGGGFRTASATNLQLGDHGIPIGPITAIRVIGSEVLIDNPTILVLSGTSASQPPDAHDDVANTPAGVPTTIDVLANDTDPDHDPLTITSVTTPLFGTATISSGGILYTPNPGVHGQTDSFSYTIDDGFGLTDSAFVTVNVLDHAPVAADDVIPMPHGFPGFFSVTNPGVLQNDTDADGDPMTPILVADGGHGHVELAAGGGFTYTPFGDFVVSDSFTYKLNDGFQDGNVATVQIVVPNQPPIASDDVDPLPHNFFGDHSVTAPGVLLNDTDPDGDAITPILFANASHGVVTLRLDGSYTYSPFDGGPVVPDAFVYRLFDGQDYSNFATVRIQVPNQAPIANNDFGRVAPGPRPPDVAPATFQVTVNDTDPDGDALTQVTLVDPPLHGTAVVNDDGMITYEPDNFISAFAGIDSFSYRVGDGISDSNLAWVTIDVSNGVPATYFDVYALPPGFTMFVDADHGLLANDYSPTGRPLEIVSFLGQSVTFDTDFGTVTQYPDGSFQYTSNVDFETTDDFTYRAGDGLNESGLEHVVIYVVNDAPEVFPDHYQIPPDTQLHVPAPGIFANDPTPGIGVSNFSTTNHGTLLLDFGDGSFTYRPVPGFIGVDSFLYSVSSGNGSESYPARVSIQVGQPPVASDDVFRVPSGGGMGLNVLANDTDPNGHELSAIALDGPIGGPSDAELRLYQPNGSKFIDTHASPAHDDPFTGVFDYVAPEDFAGFVHFHYVATDGPFQSQEATVTIHVNARPVSVDDTILLSPHSTGFHGGLLDNDTDADGDHLRARLLTSPSHVTFEGFDSSGGFQYRIPPDFHGVDSFTYEAYDDWDNSRSPATVTLVVNTPPVAVDDGRTMRLLSQTFSGLTGGLTHEVYLVSGPSIVANDTDADGDALTPPSPFNFGPGSQGQITQVFADGSMRYERTATGFGSLPPFTGSDVVTYITHDGLTESNLATVTLTAVANHAPVANNDTYTVLRNGSLTTPFPELGVIGGFIPTPPFGGIGNVAGQDTDSDHDPLTATLVAGVGHGMLSLQDDGRFTYIPTGDFLGDDTFQYQVSDGLIGGTSNVATVTIHVISPDTDVDGISDAVEEGAANGGDGNSDGIPDSQQANVASLPNAADGRYVTLVGPAGSSFVNVSAVLPPAALPPGFMSIIDFFSFSLSGITPGGSATVVAFLPSGLNPANYAKYGPTPDNPLLHWYTFNFDGTTGAELLGNLAILHFVDGQRGDDDLAANGVIEEPGGPVAFALPRIQNVLINDGSAQRSMVTSIHVTFDRQVALRDGAIELREKGVKQPLKLNVALASLAGQTVADITFKAPHVVGGSLEDGRYRLIIHGDKIRDAAGRLLDGNGDGAAGGDRVDEFFRLFGDTDGDGDVDLLDKQVFDKAFGKRSGQIGYLWYLDANANGRIWAEDLALFLLNYGHCVKRRCWSS